MSKKSHKLIRSLTRHCLSLCRSTCCHTEPGKRCVRPEQSTVRPVSQPGRVVVPLPPPCRRCLPPTHPHIKGDGWCVLLWATIVHLRGGAMCIKRAPPAPISRICNVAQSLPVPSVCTDMSPLSCMQDADAVVRRCESAAEITLCGLTCCLPLFANGRGCVLRNRR